MKKKALIIASAGIIAVLSIGGYAFAQGSDQELVNNQPRLEVKQSVETVDYNRQPKAIAEESVRSGNYNTHCWNNEDMIQYVEGNGFEDMINMHNSMMGSRVSRFRGRHMMGRFQ